MFRKKSGNRKVVSPASSTPTQESSSLASILLAMHAVTPEQLKQAQAEREAHETTHADMLLASTLRARGFCSREEVSLALKIQSRMLDGDRANVALDLMEARLERYRANDEKIREAVEKKKSALTVVHFSPATAKAV